MDIFVDNDLGDQSGRPYYVIDGSNEVLPGALAYQDDPQISLDMSFADCSTAQEYVE
jgi:hypothetical protein